MDLGVEWDLSLRFRAKPWKCADYGIWHPFADNAEDPSPAIMAECAGLTEMTPTEAERIKAIVDRLVHKPATYYLPTTHLTEHHVELTDYTLIRMLLDDGRQQYGWLRKRLWGKCIEQG